MNELPSRSITPITGPSATWQACWPGSRGSPPSPANPACPDTCYVSGLVAPGVVNTMPEATLRTVKGHGQIPQDLVRGHYTDARQVLSELRALGVDYDVTSVLEDNGLAAFDASWQGLGDQLGAQLRKRSTREENRA